MMGEGIGAPKPPLKRRPGAPRATRRGFGLLEAIVALTLLASTGIALFAWIQQNLQAASRVRAIEQEAQLQINANALMTAVNPMLRPSGTMQVSGLSLRWEAQPLEPPQRNLAFSTGVPGAWRVGLYRLDVQARDERSGTEVRFERWLVGTQRVEAPPREGP
jgi:general secretion pathway protein I